MIEEHGRVESHDDTEQPTEQASACGPACGCCTSAGSGRARWVLGALVVVVAVALAGRAVVKGKDAAAQASTVAFAAPQRAEQPRAPETAPVSASSRGAEAAEEEPATDAPVPAAAASVPVQKDVPAGAAPAAAPASEAASAPPVSASAVDMTPTSTPMACCGAPILSLGDLNRVAMDKDGVFVFLAGKDAAKARAAVTVIEKAAATIGRNGIDMGLFTLGDGSPEYAHLAAQVPPPGVVALVKGRGASAVTGEITESRLVQAFVAASSGGGCGSGGSSCGPASAGCR